ncbi:uncharacterized protein LOC143298028 [Babylonia areolata]|uniref:uncharacterized protein LOC143298028 n=1 Tax=Babylonia areolata TaxID=304850 RepID=UPI003FD4CF1D
MSSTKGDSSGLLQSLAVVSAGGSGGSSSSSSSSSAATASGTSKALSTTNWFTTEIQQMMYGFGDCRRTLTESAVLVEEIVHQQMGSLLVQAAEVATMRGSRFIGLEEMLFLLRKDKVKLRRLLRYLELKDLKVATLKGSGLDEEDLSEIGDAKPQIMKRRRKMCYDFLSCIDQTGELVALFEDQSVDTVKHERLVRAELMSRNLDPQQYKEFCEARQANFSRRYKSQRFKDWLMVGLNMDIKPNPQGLEVISYLAYETVAQIVDLSLIVKQDGRAVACQPEKRMMAHVQHNYHDLYTASLLTAQAKAAAGAGTGSPAKVEGGGFQSPPTTPTPGAAGNNNNTATTNNSHQGMTTAAALAASLISVTTAATTSIAATTTTTNPATPINVTGATTPTTGNAATTPLTPTSGGTGLMTGGGVGGGGGGGLSLTSPTASGSGSASAAAAAAAARLKKKRKKSGPATTLDVSWDTVITPADIREAMRRYFEDIGPFAFTMKVRRPSIARTRLLCA